MKLINIISKVFSIDIEKIEFYDQYKYYKFIKSNKAILILLDTYDTRYLIEFVYKRKNCYLLSKGNNFYIKNTIYLTETYIKYIFRTKKINKIINE